MVEDVKLGDLVAVSNYSKITRNVCDSLKGKLSKEEIKDFELWLKLLNYYGQLNTK